MFGPHPIEGIWQMVRAELAGEQAPQLVIEKTQIQFHSGNYTVWFAGEESDRGTYVFGVTREPHSITLRSSSGMNAGRIIPCIFQLVGGRLRICYGLDGKPPKAFATTGNSDRYLATYRRPLL